MKQELTEVENEFNKIHTYLRNYGLQRGDGENVNPNTGRGGLLPKSQSKYGEYADDEDEEEDKADLRLTSQRQSESEVKTQAEVSQMKEVYRKMVRDKKRQKLY